MPERSQYSFLGALRLFSLAVALISVGLGIRLGWDLSDPQYTLAFLLLLGGILSQAGMNLVNDAEDLQQDNSRGIDTDARKRIIWHQRLGWIAFGAAALIGCYLISIRGWPLAGILLLSALLALNYNSGPLNFKHNGIAIFQVFLLMGLLMVEASYFVMSGEFSLRVLWISLPVSLLISLLLLSNEIRDFEHDLAHATRTFSVRIGLPAARAAYWILIAAAYGLTLVFVLNGWLRGNYLVTLLPSLAFLPLLYRHLYSDDRILLTPLSGRFFLLFGLAYLLLVPVGP